MFGEFDHQLSELQGFTDTVAGFMLKKARNETKHVTTQKDQVKQFKDTLFQQLARTGTPRLLSKVFACMTLTAVHQVQYISISICVI